MRLGSQTPALVSLPEAATSAGDDAADFAASVGLDLDPWQKYVLEGALGEQGLTWAAFEVAVLVSRQNGKGTILEARELAGIELFGERLIMHTAHELKTAEEARLRMEQICEASPDLDRSVKRVVRTNGKESIEFKNGARIKYLARSKGSGRGFTGDLIVIDEAMYLTTGAMAALLPTLTTADNPQIWYMASAGFPESTQLAELRSRGQTGQDPSLAYFEWSAPETSGLDDIDAWYLANPALGIRISREYVEAERAALSPEDFARERLGHWITRADETVIPLETWNGLYDQASEIVGTPVLAVDVSPTRASSAVAVAGERADGLRHIELVEHRRGTAWVVDRVAEIVAANGVTVVVLDPAGPAGSLIPTFAERGIEVTTTRARDFGQACGAFYDAVVQGNVRHLGQAPLTVAVDGAKKRNLGDLWAWHRKAVTIDITPLVAVTLALWGFGQTKISDTGEIPNIW